MISLPHLNMTLAREVCFRACLSGLKTVSNFKLKNVRFSNMSEADFKSETDLKPQVSLRYFFVESNFLNFFLLKITHKT